MHCFQALTKVIAKGFTLVELLVTLSILAMMLVAGIPGMTALLSSMDVRSTSDKLVDTIAYARVQAVSQVSSVRVCASTCDLSTTWSDGWQVFVDSDNDGNFAANELLRVEENSANNTTITSAQSAIDFDFQGQNVGAQLQITVDKGGEHGRVITVGSAGFVSVSNQTAPSED